LTIKVQNGQQHEGAIWESKLQPDKHQSSGREGVPGKYRSLNINAVLERASKQENKSISAGHSFTKEYLSNSDVRRGVQEQITRESSTGLQKSLQQMGSY